MPFFSDKNRGANGAIVTFGTYHPWGWHKAQGGDGGNYPQFSKMILDLKDDLPQGINFFAKLIGPELGSGFTIVVVPSHDPAKTGGGLAKLVTEITRNSGRFDASGELVRHTKIAKLATGGERGEIGIHLKSIRLATPGLIRGRHVMILDDVTTSGNSLTACEQIILAAGAKTTVRVALGQTG